MNGDRLCNQPIIVWESKIMGQLRSQHSSQNILDICQLWLIKFCKDLSAFSSFLMKAFLIDSEWKCVTRFVKKNVVCCKFKYTDDNYSYPMCTTNAFLVVVLRGLRRCRLMPQPSAQFCMVFSFPHFLFLLFITFCLLPKVWGSPFIK